MFALKKKIVCICLSTTALWAHECCESAPETKVVTLEADAAPVKEVPLEIKPDAPLSLEKGEPQKTPLLHSPDESTLLKTITFALQVKPEEGKAIDEIITTLGKNSVIALGFKQSHLKALGKQLHGIGPLQFLGYIFSHPDLKGYMGSIRKSSFKWSGFMGGIKPSLAREAESSALFKEIPGFASFLGANAALLEEAAKKGEWDEFVSLLIEEGKKS